MKRSTCAVLEVGLGGRLDATNIIDADVGVVCSIGLDHLDWLGNTLEQIGREKAGIFRAVDARRCSAARRCRRRCGPPSIRWARGRWCQAVTTTRGHRRWAGISSSVMGAAWAAQSRARRRPPDRATLPLHWRRYGVPGFEPEHRKVSEALRSVRLAGRFQRVSVASERGAVEWIFDVAHNVPAASGLEANSARAAARAHDCRLRNPRRQGHRRNHCHARRTHRRLGARSPRWPARGGAC